MISISKNKSEVKDMTSRLLFGLIQHTGTIFQEYLDQVLADLRSFMVFMFTIFALHCILHNSVLIGFQCICCLQIKL
jgi:hypothetical protein